MPFACDCNAFLYVIIAQISVFALGSKLYTVSGHNHTAYVPSTMSNTVETQKTLAACMNGLMNKSESLRSRMNSNHERSMSLELHHDGTGMESLSLYICSLPG